MSQRVFERRRPDGGIEVVVIVSEDDFNQALRGLKAHAVAEGCSNAATAHLTKRRREPVK